MLNSEAIDELARAYHAAEKSRQRTRAGSVLHPGFSIDDAYAVQRRCVEIKISEGNTVRGRKIGLTSRAMQRATSMAEPDYGALLADMFYESGAADSDCPIRPATDRVRAWLCYRQAAQGSELHHLRRVECNRICRSLPRDCRRPDSSDRPGNEAAKRCAGQHRRQCGCRRSDCRRPAGTAARGRSALGGSTLPSQWHDRGIRCCRRCAQSPGQRSCLACQQAFQLRCRA